MKKSLGTPLVALACGLLLVSCDGFKQKEQAPVKYETQIMKPETRIYNEYIPAALHGINEADVYPQVTGIIRKMLFTEGNKVEKGQPLFVIDETEYRLRVQNAEANLLTAKAKMETTKLTYESTKNLAAKNIVSDYVLSASLNEYDAAQAMVQQAQAQLAIAQTNLGYCTVKAPISGMIKENGFRKGELVDISDLLCTVSDNNQIQAWFSYTESQLLDLVTQYKLVVTADGLKSPDGRTAGKVLPKVKMQLKNGQVYRYEGEITEIGGIVDRKTGTVIARATFPNPDDELRSGLSVTLILPTMMSNVFRIRKTAAVHLQDRLLFYRVRKDGTAEGVVCEAIPSNSGNHYYVKSGLRAGDEVVVKGAQKLSVGAKVR